jgi:hypothetical protein
MTWDQIIAEILWPLGLAAVLAIAALVGVRYIP